ncbi:methionine---tRNA ligase [Synchytrium endobioticum]|uniref:Methionine--tRNA ligase, mitochondrial n=1 Tax=Synchytrium endobioticum TaxID=286115 RepID=A0A507DFB1_9FUNG|nr:methionine---tRNA ligase [Synchytrium endobioticum]
MSVKLLLPDGRRLSSITTKPAFVSSPIFYVNSVPHIGHLYSMVVADVLKRFHELQGAQVIYSTGTDEHGLKIQEAARKAGKPPSLFCDEISASFVSLAKRANVSYTDFIRTTEPRHSTAVSALWTRLLEKGYIYKGHHEGWYSISDETFYPASQIEDVVSTDGRGSTYKIARETGQRVEWTREENYKFRLGSMRDSLLQWLHTNPEVIVPKPRYSEVLKFVDSMPQSQESDLSISRLKSRLQWGIPVPNDSDHVVYVWLDALTNYLTVTGYPWIDNSSGTHTNEKRDAWPATWHVVGKDILKFHAVYWPAFLIAAGLPPPERLVVHAHWLVDHVKMSKSRGNVVKPFKLLDDFGVDAVRYFLVRDGGLVDDAEFSLSTLRKRKCKDLADQLGNFSLRCTASSMVPDGVVPHPGDHTDDDWPLLCQLKDLHNTTTTHLSNAQLSQYLETVSNLVSEANKYWQSSQPWKLDSSSPRLNTIVYLALETCRVAAGGPSILKKPKIGLSSNLPPNNGIKILESPRAIILHALRVGGRAFLLGYCLRAGLNLALKLIQVLRKRTSLSTAIRNALIREDTLRFAIFIGGFGCTWKLVDNTMRLMRKVDDKWNGFFAGCLAGLALLAETKDRRIMLGQQLTVRALETIFNSLRLSQTFHFPFASSLIFMLGTAQVMYAYVLQQHTIPTSYYKFILDTGPIPEDVLGLVRKSVRGVGIAADELVDACVKSKGTEHALTAVKSIAQELKNGGSVPVVPSLNIVPLALLRMPDFVKRPAMLSLRALVNAVRSSMFLAIFVSAYQGIICSQRSLIKHGFLKADSKYMYWFAGMIAALAIRIENPGQRNNLAIYVLPRAAESLYTILYQRKWVIQIKYFEVAMFSAATGIIIAYFQTEPDALGGIVFRILQRANIIIEDQRRGRPQPPTRGPQGKLAYMPISGKMRQDKRGSFF